jgi:cAMP and cAMP-inhibited cGMP 3',5'-cyclic phosphodiesterase 10
MITTAICYYFCLALTTISTLSEPISSTTTNSVAKLAELTDQRRLLHELTDEVNQNVTKAQILFELNKSIASTIAADGFNLYLVDETGDSMRLYNTENDDEQAAYFVPIQIGNGHCIAGYVAWAKETVRIDNIESLDTNKYPDGLYIKDDKVTTVMAHPIINASGTLLGVVEFYRVDSTIPFSDEDEEEILKCVNELFTQTYYELYHSMTRERRLNDFLLAVTKSIFQELISMDAVMLKIMSYAKKLVNADRASLFIVDSRTKELHARIFDIGREEHDNMLDSSAISDRDGQKRTSSDERACIRFPMDKGIAGYVATTGKTLNITDAYSDNRFNRDIDQKTGYKTQTLLCMPIMIQGNVIGVVQMVNKKNGHFTKSDEESFETFAVYCGLALHHASLYDRIRRSEQKCKVALEVLSYHASCTDEEYERMKTYTLPDNIPNIDRFEYSPWDVVNDMKPLYVVYMFLDLANMDLLNANRFDSECLMRFILTVRKNYRNVPYHNWSHAFSVAHAIYTVIKQTKNHFTPNDCIALFVACLCHDLDHRGKTNTFMVRSASTLASIYSTSTMERHHFNQTVTILQTESHNIFKHFSSKEYRQMLDEIRHCILATDLALFFDNRPKFQRIVDQNEFDWNNKEHL